ncbi:MAG TPA: alpha/beta fold hydrolase [Blastocatellia bacterium]|nr:alpha/beta fold hydrolase [Blastocatellia bacterium]
MTNADNRWFRVSQKRGQVDLKLFCFPYAGGAAVIYRDWENYLPSNVQLFAVELPGRGRRLKEPFIVDVPTMVEALADAVLPLLDMPFAFFGHSLGAVLAFELARRLRRANEREPELLIASGRRAPQIPDTDPVSYNLPADELIAELHRMAGTPKEVLDHAELMELMLPLLRADFQLVQTYQYTDDDPLGCPITVFGGLQDKDVGRESLLAWEEQTTSSFALRMMPGDHFFLRSSQALLLERLSLELSSVILQL